MYIRNTFITFLNKLKTIIFLCLYYVLNLEDVIIVLCLFIDVKVFCRAPKLSSIHFPRQVLSLSLQSNDLHAQVAVSNSY